MILLGSKVRDKVTGFIGIVVGRTEYLYASPQVWLAYDSLDDAGRLRDRVWFEEAQVEVLEIGAGKSYGLLP